jgi:hypothetical protein
MIQYSPSSLIIHNTEKTTLATLSPAVTQLRGKWQQKVISNDYSFLLYWITNIGVSLLHHRSMIERSNLIGKEDKQQETSCLKCTGICDLMFTDDGSYFKKDQLLHGLHCTGPNCNNRGALTRRTAESSGGVYYCKRIREESCEFVRCSACGGIW